MMEGPTAVVPATALEAIERAEVDVGVATAKRYPRDVKAAVARALEMATATPEIAAECFYVLKRKDSRTGKTNMIDGESIRLAEIFACAWGNITYGFRATEDDGKAVTVQGLCWDQETNVRCSKPVRRNVLDRNGRRFSEDMVTVTTMAAGSIACRNAIFGVIPGVYVKEVAKAARRVAVGEAKSLTGRRDKAVAYFKKLGLDEARVLAVLERESIDAVTDEDVKTLLGLANAIRDGVMTLEEAFPMPGAAPAAAATDPGASRTEALAQELFTETPPPAAPEKSKP
jgi:hypothetical protein